MPAGVESRDGSNSMCLDIGFWSPARGTRAVEKEVNIYRLAGRGVYDCGIVEIILIAVPEHEGIIDYLELISSRNYVEKCIPLAVRPCAEIRLIVGRLSLNFTSSKGCVFCTCKDRPNSFPSYPQIEISQSVKTHPI